MSTTPGAAVTDTPSTSNSPLQPVITAAARIKDVSLHVFSQRKPMSEILDRTAYAKPASFSDATSRMQKNLNYFKINYMIATLGILSAFILYHPSSLLVLSAISAAWAYVFMIRQEPLKIGERELSSREKMLGMTGLSALIIFFLTSAGTYIFSGMGVALLGIGAHSAARVPDDLFIDDAAESNGFFSFMVPPRPGQPTAEEEMKQKKRGEYAAAGDINRIGDYQSRVLRRVNFVPARRAEPPSTGGMMTSNSSGGLNGRRRVGKTIVLNGVRENRDNSKNKPSSLEEEEEENTRDGKSNDRKRKKAEDEEEEEDGSSGDLYPLSKIQMEWQNVSKIGSGLQNLGNTCFLNAVLQCLTYTPALANFFLNNEHQKHKNLTSGFNSLFEMGNLVKNTLVHSKNKHHAVPPTAFVKNIRALSKTFKKGRQEDSHEFARCLLDSMHKRCCMLGRVNGGKSSSARNGKQVTPIDPESKEAETTFIWRVFGGQLRSCVTCQSCGRESAKLDPCMDMSLECAKVKSLEQALKLFTRVEVLDGDNKYRCEGCKKLSRAKKQFSVDKAPNVLQIQLKRFEFVPFGRGKLSQFIEYPLVLNLTSYLTSSLKANEGRREKKRNKSGGNNNMLDDIMGGSSKGKASSSSSSVYDLIGVLVHAGSSMNSGHYYSYVKAQNGFWFEMDDESVTSVSEKTVLRQKAYLLFYSLRNAPGTMTTKKTNTGNVDKNRMEELTRDFQAKKRKLDEEREKGKKTMTMKQERDSNINKSGSGNGSSSSSEGEEEEEKEEEEEVVTVISARKNGKRGAGRSVGKNSRDVVKSKLFKQNRSGSKSPDFGIVKQKKRSKRASYSEDDAVAYDEEEDKENKREKGNMMVKTFMKSRAQRDKSTQRWNDGDDDDDNDKSEALRMRQQSSKPQKKNAKKSREYDELDEEYDRGKIAKHLRRREQKMPSRPAPSRAAGGNAFARKQGRKYQR